VSDEGYARAVSDGLGRAFDDPATEEVRLDVDEARLVVFSDHHRGTRDGADDFLRCERAYNAALAAYRETGHRLLLLGDADELWECRPADVLRCYPRTLELEAAFHADGRLDRFWGNHDDEWASARAVRRHLHPRFPGLRVREALKLRVVEGDRPLGLLFLVHGHQGTAESDRFSWLSRIVVRHVWRPLQRRVGFASTSPSRDWALRERHDVAMFGWARTHPARPVLVAGHTHRPVFASARPEPDVARPEAEVRAELEHATDRATRARLLAELEFLHAEQRRVRPPTPVEPPCYFNTGCCSFGDGDITGLELAGGELRLVRWPDEAGRPDPVVLARAALRDVLARVAAPGAAPRGDLTPQGRAAL
jgi:UDP-2,3-diacylglucosamine pyrophosphatase LpxH